MPIQNKGIRKTAELIIFALLGTVMFISKIVMEGLPNIHIIGMLIIVYTIVFRVKALIPIYVFVFLTGIYMGFSVWWIPYIYVWTVLWGAAMLLPRNMPVKVKRFVYPVTCLLHGLLFGTIYAPAFALLMGMNFDSMIAWIVAGFPFDATHGIGNFVLGFLCLPLSEFLEKTLVRYGILPSKY